MVKTFIFLMLMTFTLNGSQVIVTSEMNYTQLYSGRPLTGSITITHDKNEAVDLNSFKLGTKPLTVSFLNDVQMSNTSPLIVSLYSFEIPTLPKGLHVLPQVFVKVGDKVYKSYSSSFQVFAAQGVNTSAPPVEQQPASAPLQTSDASLWEEVPELLLVAKVDGPTKLYPGQQTKFVYKYLYRGHINLTKEMIPLLEGVGLKKVGDKLIADYVENNLNVSEFSQIFEAESPGNFIYGPSIIEGLAYQENSNGEKIFASTPLRSEAPPVAIEVLPFPQKGKPASFNGAIGTYTFNASLKNSDSATQGEKIVLLLEMSGHPNFISTVKAPDLNLQPGFSGIFKPSDLPPISSMVNNTKQFLVELKPLSSFVKEIPLIEFSSFEPVTTKYIVLRSPPIPLNVLKTNRANADNITSKTNEQEIQMDKEIKIPGSIQISGIFPLVSSDLQNNFFGTYWNLLFIPAFAVLLLTEWNLKNEWLSKKPVIKELSSEEIFKSALQTEAGSPDFYRLLQKTFITALHERGSLLSSDIEPENLEKTGLQGDVRIFLTKLDEVRFSGNKKFSQAIISSAKELYSKIKGISS